MNTNEIEEFRKKFSHNKITLNKKGMLKSLAIVEDQIVNLYGQLKDLKEEIELIPDVACKDPKELWEDGLKQTENSLNTIKQVNNSINDVFFNSLYNKQMEKINKNSKK